MKRRLLILLTAAIALLPATMTFAAEKELRVGIIGLDTSHVLAFAGMLNSKDPGPEFANCRVVAAYPKGSPDIESSTKRVPEYTEKIKAMGIEIVDSIDALLEKVDVVLLETNDGRPHYEQVLPVLKAGKPVFIDKPIAGSLTDAVAIFEAARYYDVPVFSSSSLRYSAGAQAIRNGAIGEVVGCDAYSPCSLEATHPDFYWYGIHGVETLFTCMGTGCKSVVRVGAPDMDVAVGTWDGGRIGTFRGIRGKGGYGGTAFGTKEIRPIGKYDGYKPLLVEIVKFFRTGKAPVSAAETLQIYAFMEAADESKRQGGVPVTLASVMKTARASAAEKSLAIPNQLTEAEKADGWRLLFNGKDHSGWHCNNGQEIATPVEEGSLVPFKSGGYLIIHEDQFGDFVLKCDVKMSSADCNSGIFFRVADPKNPVMTGFEAQVYSGGTGIHDFGAIYDLVPATRDVVGEPGDWNSLQITCKGPHIQVVANGEVVSEMNCDDFTEKGLRPDGTEHKFGSVIKDAARKGYLGFQDHGQKVWVRNVKIKELD